MTRGGAAPGDAGIDALGYAYGVVGYLPPAAAFEDAEDYACRCAPKFFQLFPFTPEVEPRLLDAAREALRAIG